MSHTQAALAWCPFPDRVTARQVSNQIVSEKHAACANILPGVESVFEWQGGVDASQEVAVLFKTRAIDLEALVHRLGELHPYDTPAIVGWICDAAHPATLDWLGSTLG